MVNIIINNLIFLEVMSSASIVQDVLTLYYSTSISIPTSSYPKYKQMQKDNQKGLRWNYATH